MISVSIVMIYEVIYLIESFGGTIEILFNACRILINGDTIIKIKSDGTHVVQFLICS